MEAGLIQPGSSCHSFLRPQSYGDMTMPSSHIIGKCRHWIVAMGSPGWSAAVTAREIVHDLGEEVAEKVLDLLCANPNGLTYGEAVAQVQQG